MSVLAAPALADDAPAPAEDRDTLSPAQLRIEERLRRVEAVTELFNRQTRLWRLSYPLLYGAVDMCPDRIRASAGFSYANAYLFRGAARSAANALGYDHRVSVVDVAPGSAAAAAGIQRRDVLVAIGDWQSPIGDGAVSLAAAMLRDTLERSGAAVLTMARGRDSYQAKIKPDYICDLQVIAAPGDMLSAYADGDRVVVFHGMMDFIADDGELAAVIAHEIANSLLPGLGIAGSPSDYSLSNFFNWGMEPEATGDPVDDRARAHDRGLAADYVAAYLLARAGFDHRALIGLWRRVAAAGLVDADGGYSIPDAERTARLAATIVEVDAKLASHGALAPSPDGPPAAPAEASAATVEVAAPAATVEVVGLPWAAPVETVAVETEVPDIPAEAPIPAAGIEATGAVEVEGMPWTAPAESAVAGVAVPHQPPPAPARLLPSDESMHQDVAMTALGAPEPAADVQPAPDRAGFSFVDWFGR